MGVKKSLVFLGRTNNLGRQTPPRLGLKPGILRVDLEPAHELRRELGQIFCCQLSRGLDFRLDGVGDLLIFVVVVVVALLVARQLLDLDVAVFDVT